MATIIKGTITDAGGKRLGQVPVTITPAPPVAGVQPFNLVTNAQGDYTQNVPAGTYDVTVQPPPGYLAPQPIQVPVAANATGQADFQLAPSTGSIGGTVLGPGAVPVSAQVTATPVGAGGPSGAATDGQGKYEIQGLAPGNYTVSVAVQQPANHQNPNPAQAAVVAGQKAPLDFQLQAAGGPPAQLGSITGQVTGTSPLAAAVPPVAAAVPPVAAGVPLQNVQVIATPQAGQPAPAPVFTDDQGRYAINNVAPGNYAVAAYVPGSSQNPPAAQAVVAQAPVVLDFSVPNDSVAVFMGALTGSSFNIETSVSLTEASYATSFFRIANLVFAGHSVSGQPLDVFGSQRIASVADQLGIQETDQTWLTSLKDAEQLKKNVTDLIGTQSLDGLKREARRQFNLGRDTTINGSANIAFPDLFWRYVSIATNSLLTMDIDDQDVNNRAIDKTRIGEADKLLAELKETIVRIVRSLSKEGRAQTRLDTEGWVPVAQRALDIAKRLGPLRKTGDLDDQNPWAVLSVMTAKDRDAEVTPYIVLSRHGGQLLELAIDIYRQMDQRTLSSYEPNVLRQLFQDPRARNTRPRAFFTDLIREHAMIVARYPLQNWGNAAVLNR